MRIALLLLLTISCLASSTFAQQENTDSLKKDSASSWSFSVESDYYIFPYDQNILMFIGTADHKMLHLEARYNYENRNTASVFGGLNFTFGNQLQLLLTPMVGIAFGSLNGLVPGLEVDLTYKTFYFNSQSEYLFDFTQKENDFAYTYLQLGTSLFKHLEVGLAGQRTRLYQSSLDLQRGIYLGYSFHNLNALFTTFNLFTDSYFFIATLSIDF